MLDWQNRITDERYRFFGIEVKVWQIEDSARAVQFDVVSSPNDWSRGVSRDTQRAANEVRYSGLRMNDNGSSVNCPAPRNYLQFSIGRTTFTVASSKGEIGIGCIWQFL